MRQVLIRKGRVSVEEVPAPEVRAGTVLVGVECSCISTGTEISAIRASETPLWKQALRQPEKIKRVVSMVLDEGVAQTKSAIDAKFPAATPVGYSVAGVVIQVGKGVDDLSVGQRVACAGAQCAHHAEMICAPRNLAVQVPEGVSPAVASTVALGSIALQGVRRLDPTIGEFVVVLGLGVLGQIVVQLLRANGCRVIGVDLCSRRADLARSLGADFAMGPDSETDFEGVSRLTDGVGAEWPIPCWQLLQVTEIANDVENQIVSGSGS